MSVPNLIDIVSATLSDTTLTIVLNATAAPTLIDFKVFLTSGPYSTTGAIFDSDMMSAISLGGTLYSIDFLFDGSLGTNLTLSRMGLSVGSTIQIQIGNMNGGGPTILTKTVTAPLPPAPEPTVPCFLGDALVQTSAGYRRIDSLVEGDDVITPSGNAVTIEHVKCYSIMASKSTNPYIIESGTFGATSRLLISPDHKVLVNGEFIKARDLGLTQSNMTGTLIYYNLQLEGEAPMVVQGVPVESLAHVKRIVMTRKDFERIVRAKYGAMTPSVLAMINHTCRLVGDSHIECPVIRKTK
jgi:hypothetical protein